jgi:acetyltransferase-like isoleucine patch superfamily enzyme
MKKTLTAFLCFLPTKFTFWILNLMGHEISSTAKIGFSFIWISNKLTLSKHSKIGHLNRISINNLTIEEAGYIGNLNSIKGPLEIVLAKTAAIGNNNAIYRAPIGVTYSKSTLTLGVLSKITGNHRIDCTRNISIGNYTTIAGHNSQLWTHGYYHDQEGPGRFRVDGNITIGDNVYIGSACIINAGVTIANKVVVGAGSCISKSLLNAGTYVNQPLRFIESSPNADLRLKFKKVEGYTIEEEVYEKK